LYNIKPLFIPNAPIIYADSDESFQCSVDNNADEMGVNVPSGREGRRIVELGLLIVFEIT
jgi:hypothetical protein